MSKNKRPLDPDEDNVAYIVDARDAKAMAHMAECVRTDNCTDLFHIYPGCAKPLDPCKCGKTKFLEDIYG